MDTNAVTTIIKNIETDYDIKDADDITQLIIDLLYTFDAGELADAKLMIKLFLEGN